MSVESVRTRGDDHEQVTGHVHDVSDLTVEGLQSFAREAVEGEVHLERQGDRTLLLVD